MTSTPDTKRRYDFRRAAIGVVTIVALLTIGALWQRAHPYSIETGATIDASPEEVRAAIDDDPAFNGWVAGPDDSLRLETHEGVVGWFDGERTLTLDELDGGGTQLTQTALFRGVSVLFRADELRDDTAPSLHAMNAALRERAEADAR